MAVLSELEEPQKPSDPSSSSSSSLGYSLGSAWSVASKDPINLVSNVFDFLRQNSDLFGKDTAESEVLQLFREQKRQFENDSKLKVSREKKKREYEVKEAEVVKPLAPMKLPESSSAKASELPDIKEKAEKTEVAPNSGNGADLEAYSWTQTLQEVDAYFRLPKGTKAKFVSVNIQKKNIQVGLKGQAPILEGELWGAVKTEDCFWSIEDGSSLHVNLQKVKSMEWWKTIVRGQPEIDTQKIEPESSNLNELDPETRQTVEKMMFDQRQKALGLPTSEERQKNEILKKFIASHPEMDFSKVKLPGQQ